MEKLISILEKELKKAFCEAGYDESYAKVTVSNRPDLCEYQCNGAMAAAKTYHKAPFMIADDVVEKVSVGQDSFISVIETVKPGFININVDPEALGRYLTEMGSDEYLGIPQTDTRETIILDYGGPNVAKPLHVGHLRSAVIGEAVKRIDRAVGQNAIGDIHLGDWGLQIGLIITETAERYPDLVYFDENYEGDYPKEAPFTIGELEEIYPSASGRSKADEEYKNRALQATHELQEGRRGYRELWKKIMEISVTDLKKNYARLNVDFELWKAESDAQPYIPELISTLRDKGIARVDQGALIVDVAQEDDKKEIPPCIVLKSDGASLYATTDLATIMDRVKNYDPEKITYIVDKRQEMHFVQVFRTARKAGLVSDNVELKHIGFGTMNGADGKPFKTREGGVMRLENLIADINEEMENKIRDNRNIRDDEVKRTAEIVGLAALKYGDLSNQATKDYIFDVDKFTSFEGNTGPYILYTIVRIKSIINKYVDEVLGKDGQNEDTKGTILAASSDAEKKLQLILTDFGPTVWDAYEQSAPHRICSYIYELANTFNTFYHETKIISETDREKQKSWIALITLAKEVMEKSIDMLGFEAPDHM
ncbi:MAG: arginine--tRNA ligase [Lachnospiraceae bacterium]|jgi:arginyl-tRNA synthetase